MRGTQKCPRCFGRFQEGEAVLCREHPVGAFVCPRCGQCSCLLESPCLPRPTPDPVVEAFRQKADRFDWDLLGRHREVFERFQVVPVGISGRRLYAYAASARPRLREELLTALEAAGLDVDDVLIAVRPHLSVPGARRVLPLIAVFGAVGWDETGRTVDLDTAEVERLRKHSVAFGAVFYPRFHVRLQPPPGEPRACRIRMACVPLELWAIREWLGREPAFLVASDPLVRRLAEGRFIVTDSALEALYTGLWSLHAAAGLWTLRRGDGLPAEGPGRVRTTGVEPCGCGACPGFTVLAALELPPFHDSERSEE